MPGAEARAACARDDGVRWRVTWDRRENMGVDVASRRARLYDVRYSYSPNGDDDIDGEIVVCDDPI
jgi:hypothetical protein